MAMTIKGSLHPLPSDRWHYGSKHPPGLRRNYRVGLPRETGLGIVQPNPGPHAPNLLRFPSLCSLGRVTECCPQGPLLSALHHPREGGPGEGAGTTSWVAGGGPESGPGRRHLFSQQLKLAVQVQGHCFACIVWEPQDTRRGRAKGPPQSCPQGIRGVLGPNGGPGGFGPRAVPRRDNANLRADLGVLGKPEAATRPRPGSGGRVEGQATQVGLLSESARVSPQHAVSGPHDTLAQCSILRMDSRK